MTEHLDIKFVKLRDYYNAIEKNKIEFELYRMVVNNNLGTTHYLGVAVQYGKTEIQRGYIGTIAKIRIIQLYDYMLDKEMNDHEFIKYVLKENKLDGHLVWNYRTSKLQTDLLLDTRLSTSSYQYNKLDDNVDYVNHKSVLYFRDSQNYIQLDERIIITKAIEHISGYKNGEYTVFDTRVWESIFPNIVE